MIKNCSIVQSQGRARSEEVELLRKEGLIQEVKLLRKEGLVQRRWSYYRMNRATHAEGQGYEGEEPCRERVQLPSMLRGLSGESAEVGLSCTPAEIRATSGA